MSRDGPVVTWRRISEDKSCCIKKEVSAERPGDDVRLNLVRHSRFKIRGQMLRFVEADADRTLSVQSTIPHDADRRGTLEVRYAMRED